MTCSRAEDMSVIMKDEDVTALEIRSYHLISNDPVEIDARLGVLAGR